MVGTYGSVSQYFWLSAAGETAGAEGGADVDRVLPGINTHELMTHWCLAEDDGRAKQQRFYMPLVNPDTVAYFNDLFAKVVEQVPDPVIEWKNKDLDHDWLWVRVEHFVGLDPVEEIFAEARAGDAVTGEAHAWVRATPTRLTLEVPGAEDTEGVASCDLETATSEEGCSIRFVHASSIDPSGEFHGTVVLEWEVTSNSGRYDGLDFTTEGEFSIVVAEAMAVTRSNN